MHDKDRKHKKKEPDGKQERKENEKMKRTEKKKGKKRRKLFGRKKRKLDFKDGKGKEKKKKSKYICKKWKEMTHNGKKMKLYR